MMIHKCTHTFAHIMSASFVLKPVCIALVAGTIVRGISNHDACVFSV